MVPIRLLGKIRNRKTNQRTATERNEAQLPVDSQLDFSGKLGVVKLTKEPPQRKEVQLPVGSQFDYSGKLGIVKLTEEPPQREKKFNYL